MGLGHLGITGFRVFTTCDFEPDPIGTTVLTGPNGTGKTSLLEAVGYLGLGRSLRGSPRDAMVKNGGDIAIVRAQLVINGRDLLVEAEIARVGRSRMQINRQPVRSRRELAELIPVSTFCPDDLLVVQGPPAGRRQLLDDALVQLDPLAGKLLEDVEKIIRQRNALLKGAFGRKTPEVLATLDVWDDRLAGTGGQLMARRAQLLDELGTAIDDAYRALSGDEETGLATVQYLPSAQGDLREALAQARDDDVRRGVTTTGPHRDDVLLLLEGRDAKTQASQGEQRTFALALRLAVHLAAKERRGDPPLLLLDDVFSELDPDRSRRLITELPPGQTLITTASPLPPGVEPARVVDVGQLVLAGG